jgi:energy-coupling factor transporter ATP-binding protein EcfA2
MKYRDLIQFEAVTEVIQLLSANQKENAAQLVSTYVISDRMADVILHRILPALSLEEGATGRGIFIVGNYGTGKSHLMAVISGIAEHADLLEKVNHPIVQTELSQIAGKFKVVRQETAATKMDLRDVVLIDLERQLKAMGVDYHFPSMKEAPSNKLLLAEMMAVFNQKYPDHGLLIVLDELLDFLKARDEKEIIMDLNFLREIGEACETLPLRFVSGIQEALFDNPGFAFVGDSIKRVKSRFDQASIIREDIAYVVSHRLLTKTEGQKNSIRKHLEGFTVLYEDMAERLDDFVEMFPVHPTYLVLFEQVSVGERRDLLKALSTEMNALIDDTVPEDAPGLITFDSYWRMMRQDDAFRTIPDVREVQDKARVLSEKVKYAEETKDYRPTALRMIDGLALHRLTVSDIYAPIGITPAEIRDQLCISLPLPEKDADFLLATIETILQAISRAVNGQFISHNKDNDQYYLDLKKDIDFEALIEQKAATLSPDTVDRYYFELIKNMLEITESSYVPGFRIWEREMPWPGHGITRRGYLFLGASNERSTAQPERDFYILFHGLFGNGIENTQPHADEVYFLPAELDPEFVKTIRLFAGASEMSGISSGSNKDQYDAKGRGYLRQLQRWLGENFVRVYQVTHQNQPMGITEAIAQHHLTIRDLPFRDQIYRISSALLSEHFEAEYPQYPSFEGLELTQQTLYSGAESALRAIDGGPVTQMAQCVLEGLKLGHFQGGKWGWTIEDSPYARYFMDLVAGLADKKVINRMALLQGEPGAEHDLAFGLEPELLAVLLAALVRHGAISISVQSMRISEMRQPNGARITLEQLLRFTSISKPRAIPELAVKELFSGLGIKPELLDDPHTRDLAMTQFQGKLTEELNRVVRTIENLRDGPRFAQELILAKEAQKQRRDALEAYKEFLNSLKGLMAYARLAQLEKSIPEIRSAFKAREVLEDVGLLFELVATLQLDWAYLVQAQVLLPESDPWRTALDESVEFILATLGQPEKRRTPGIEGQLRARMENLRASYAKRYLELHQEARLDREQDQLKAAFTADPRWGKLRTLSKISLLPSHELYQLQNQLDQLKACPSLQTSDLKNNPACPYCGFNPNQETAQKKDLTLAVIQSSFENLVDKWVGVLISNLETDEAAHNITLLDEKERTAVKAFLSTQALPERITQSFIDGVEMTLQGLEVITIDGTDFLFALTEPGMPCTPEALEARIREFLQGYLGGKDRQKVRVQINW